MKGARTFVFGLAITVLSFMQDAGWDIVGAIGAALKYAQENFGMLAAWIPDQWEAVAMQLLGIAIIILRSVTNTPIFKAEKE